MTEKLSVTSRHSATVRLFVRSAFTMCKKKSTGHVAESAKGDGRGHSTAQLALSDYSQSLLIRKSFKYTNSLIDCTKVFFFYTCMIDR